MICRIPRRNGGNTYLVLLLEFQLIPNHRMALRMLVYPSLLCYVLIHASQQAPSASRGDLGVGLLAEAPSPRRSAFVSRCFDRGGVPPRSATWGALAHNLELGMAAGAELF